MTLKRSLVLFLVFSLSIFFIEAKSWWETASFYQIYPRSFKDSDGDGIGDLNGITSKLEYLKEIGFTGTWISPFLKSPMADFGYDISNFTEIDPVFGTMEDFEQLLKKAKELDIRIILDFVPNHSSDECEWFVKSAQRDPEYEDFYVWHPGKIVNGERKPPSNWISVFRGSAWQWHEGRKEFYLHQFDKKQPDFNYRNPKILRVLKDVLKFWLDKGVDGFRIDAIPHCFEAEPDENGNYPDEPLNPLVTDPDEYGYTQTIYTYDQPETLNLVYEWRSFLTDYQEKYGGNERIFMVEATGDIRTLKYYGNETAEGGQIPFNFLLVDNLTPESDVYHYVELINSWLNNMPKDKTANWVIGNHDRSRVGSHFGKERIDMFNILMLTLPGVSITYMGEEIGMLDGNISWEETVDPQACNGPEEGYETRSRDPERTPFQWDDIDNTAGFTEGSSTWMPLAANFKTINSKRERGIPLSHLSVYKKLQELRSTNTMMANHGEVKAMNRNVMAIRRFLDGDYTFVILLNIYNSFEQIYLSQAFKDIPEVLEYVLVTDKSFYGIGHKVFSKNIFLLPYECIVLRSITKL